MVSAPAPWQLTLARIEGALPFISPELSECLALASLRRLWRMHVRDYPFDNLGIEHNPGLEADELVRSWSVSTGVPGHDTNLGRFKVFAHVRIQDMGSEAAGYLTKDVPWVSYYNGDEAFHGAYWHNNFGHPMSHGCVNMRLPEAKFVYEWAPIGTEVWVHG